MNKFDFDDINLIPRQCVVESRSECDTRIIFGGKCFQMPLIPANMSSVITTQLALELAKNGYFYILHRFLDDIDIMLFLSKTTKENIVSSISIGVKDRDYALLKRIKSQDLVIDYITIDIAHGHAHTVKDMIAFIEENFPMTYIIAGNVCTRQAVDDLTHWGADAVKVGIAPGKACTTAYMTGFGSRNCQASTILECSKYARVPIIADGGIVHPGDIAKALAMGATMVMCGALLSGCSDSPGELITIDGNRYKEYFGSASQHQSGKTDRIEGTKKLIPYLDKTLMEQLKFLEQCLQSSISYGGGTDLSVFQYVDYQ